MGANRTTDSLFLSNSGPPETVGRNVRISRIG
jgi:hypothetical protein